MDAVAGDLRTGWIQPGAAWIRGALKRLLGSPGNALTILALLGLVVQGARLYLGPPIHTEYPGDFAALWSGAVTYAEGLNPYNMAIQTQIAHERGAAVVHGAFIYPPVMLLLARPLTWLPWPTAVMAMLVISVVCIALAAAILALTVPWGQRYFLVAVLIVLGVFVFHPTQWNLIFGNPNPIIFLLVAIGFWQARQRPMVAGLVLGLAAAIKITPVALVVLFLLWYRHFRLAAATIASAVVITLVSSLLVGPTLSLGYFTHYIPSFFAGNFGKPPGFPENQTVAGLSSRLLLDGWAPGGPLGWLFAPRGADPPLITAPMVARAVAIAVALPFLIISALQWRALARKGAEQQVVALALVLSVIIPQYSHAIYSIWLLPVFAWVAAAAANLPRSRTAALYVVGLGMSYAAIGIIFPLTERWWLPQRLEPFFGSLPLYGAIVLWLMLMALPSRWVMGRLPIRAA